MFMKNFKLKFEQNWPKPLLITTSDPMEIIDVDVDNEWACLVDNSDSEPELDSDHNVCYNSLSYY